MNFVDYVVIAVVLISAAIGIIRGFLREAIALATWILALLIAWKFSDLIEPYLGGLLADPMVRPWAARTLIVLFVLLLGMATGAIVAYFVRLSIFSGMDRFLGFFFGLLRGLLLVGIFVALGQLVHLESENWWKRSILIPYGEDVASALRAIVGEQMAMRREDVAAAV
jgi:membrane protein required for colicin V production